MTSRPSCSMFPRFHLLVFFYWSVQLSLGGQVNVTVDDTDPSIIYQPPELWHASSTVCSVCLNPDVRNAYLGTYHDGTYVLPAPGTDDTTAAPTTAGEAEEAAETEDDKKGKGKGGPNRRERRHARSLPHRRTDPNDPGSEVTVEFRFTGTSVYLFSIQPLGLPLVDTTPTAMNLTFNLDDNTHDTFLHQGSDAATGYAPNINVFTKTGLTETPHVLRVNVGPGSVFLFDYLIYSRSNTSDPTTPLAQDLPVPSESVSPSTKRRNIGTFAGAIGGSVGVLAIIALGLAFSIIRRRRNYARRERLSQSESLHTNASDDSPPTHGPAPFVPRFFPGTHVPADPPPYVESLTGSSDSVPSHIAPPSMRSYATIPLTYAAHLARSRDRSYAEVPPSSPPPPPLEDTLPPPPPFGVAIASQGLAKASGVVPSQKGSAAAGEAEEPHESDILVTDPLLPAQSVDASARRHSQDISS
ncbi:hypothetical protein FPV67DRAFT_1503014 [Lyophyllum atratum]|nr:hypothetical protein FPV67DRAFT_1503014 [Lyophyllum atratum]